MRWEVDTADSHQVRAAKQALCDVLRAAAGEPDDLDAARLILSELVGNVVAHAPGPALIELGWQQHHPTLTIVDRGDGFVPVPDLPEDLLAEGGRGMFIVNELARGVRVRSSALGTRIEVDLPWSATGLNGSGPAGGAAEDALRPLRAVHRLALALQHADGSPAFYDEAVGTIVDLLGVDRASLLLFDPDGVVRFKAWRGLSAEYRRAVEGHSPWQPDDVDAQPILVPDVAADPAWASYLPVFEAEGIRAVAFIPLVHRHRVAGKFMLYYRDPHAFSSAELAVAEVLAAHVALALDRRTTGEELARQQEHLQLALAAGELGTWEWDVRTDRVDWSATMEATHGLAPGTFGGTFEAFQADMHPDDQPLVLAALRAVLAGERGRCDVTYRIVRRDGALRWLNASGQLLRDGQGRPERMLGVCEDVTEQRHLLSAQRAATARLAGLQRITAELSRAVSVADVAAVVLGPALAELGASSGSLCMIDGDHLRIEASVGYAPDVLEFWERFSLEEELPAAQVVRTGRAVYLGGKAEQVERYPVLDQAPIVGAGSYAIMPLATDGIPLGALVVGFTETRDFAPDDKSLLDSLATQCAAAIARAHLYEERERARAAAERSRARLAFLAEASAELGTSLDYSGTLDRVAALAVPRLADVFTLYLLEGTRIQLVGLAHSDANRVEAMRQVLLSRPPSLDDETGTGAVLRTGRRAVFTSVPDDLWDRFTGDPSYPDVLRELGLRAAAIVPLTARGRTIGALGLAVTGREFDSEGLVLAEELAARAGAAIDNARLFDQRTTALRTLQASLLPPQLPRIEGLDLGARYQAGSAGLDVGGDFYDVFPLYGNRHLVLLGDVCGRGVEAANTAMLIRHVTRAAAVNLHSPAEILGHLNEVLLRQTDGDGDELRFCTAIVAVVHPRVDGRVAVTLSLGGHPEPLLREAGGRVRPVGIPGSVVGATDDVEFCDANVMLGPGEQLVCFTDGATERRRGRTFFGESGLAAVLQATTGDADAVAARVVEAVAGFAPSELGDDLAVLVLGPSH